MKNRKKLISEIVKPKCEITAELNTITMLVDRLNALSAGVMGHFSIALEPELTLHRDGVPGFIERDPGDMVRYLEQRISDWQKSMLHNRFQLLCFDILTLNGIEKIGQELEPLVSLYEMGFDPGTCAELHLCRENAACPLLFRLLDGTPLLQLVEDDGSIKVQIPGALLVALENYVQH